MSKRKKYFLILLVTVVGVALATFLLWYGYFRNNKYTDDAYVHGNMIELTPQVSGIVSSICVEETDFVEKDQVIIEIDPTDYEIAFEGAKATLGAQVRTVANMFATYEALKAELLRTKAMLEIAEINYLNRVPLVSSGAIAKEEFEHVTLKLQAMQSEFEAVFSKLEAQKALIADTTIQTHPYVKEAKDKVRQAWVNLKRTKVVAPTSGYIGMRKVQLGEVVTPSSSLLALVPLDEIWVNANFKETQLSKMRIGQRAKVYADMYGSSVEYRGTVVGLNPGTGNAFSILPPQNATGNWIKIVQRLPVRIAIDTDTLEQYPLMLGMSMNVTVHVENKTGPVLSKIPPKRARYVTNVYEKTEEGVEELLRDIITENTVINDGK